MISRTWPDAMVIGASTSMRKASPSSSNSRIFKSILPLFDSDSATILEDWGSTVPKSKAKEDTLISGAVPTPSTPISLRPMASTTTNCALISRATSGKKRIVTPRLWFGAMVCGWKFKMRNEAFSINALRSFNAALPVLVKMTVVSRKLPTRTSPKAITAGCTLSSANTPVPLKATDTASSSGSLLRATSAVDAVPRTVGWKRTSTATLAPGATLALAGLTEKPLWRSILKFDMTRSTWPSLTISNVCTLGIPTETIPKSRAAVPKRICGSGSKRIS